MFDILVSDDGLPDFRIALKIKMILTSLDGSHTFIFSKKTSLKARLDKYNTVLFVSDIARELVTVLSFPL